MTSLLEFTNKGIYCPQADFYIDPWRKVKNAILTHAHSDHARPGSLHYISHKDSECILRMRLGERISLRTVEYGETFHVSGVKISLHPAGHILGSAQIRVEYKGEVWVVSGDYKLQDDGFCTPFETVKCHVFITESTFGLPVYKWQPQQMVFDEITNWIADNRSQNKTSVIMGYTLGKMQRLLKNLPNFDFPIYGHQAVVAVNDRLREAGYRLPKVLNIKKSGNDKQWQNGLVLAPPLSNDASWFKQLGDYNVGYCSGWMAVRGTKNRMAADKGFILSDHADWTELNHAVEETGAQKIYVTHGSTAVFSKWLCEKGLDARDIKTMYGGAEEDDSIAIKNVL
jgi:putative mRNA 3-end processing factor